MLALDLYLINLNVNVVDGVIVGDNGIINLLNVLLDYFDTIIDILDVNIDLADVPTENLRNEEHDGLGLR